MSDFRIEKFIGDGKFGKVYLAYPYLENYPRKIALKVIKKRKLDKNKVDPKLEISILKSLNFQHIITFYDHFEDDLNVVHILEYVSGGDLYHKISQGPIDEDTSLIYLKQIAYAVAYLHRKNIMHRDIKPENILIDEKGSLKLTDFGHSIIYTDGEKVNGVYGTIYYIAPEMIKYKPYDYRIDIWMLGVLYYEMLTSKLPFDGDNRSEVWEQILEEKYTIPDNISDRTRFNIIMILAFDPERRPPLSAILKMK